MICAGIDAGSRALKIALLEAQGLKVIGAAAADQAVQQDALALALFEDVLRQAGVQRQRVRRTIATGYGRNIISLADTRVTEITCHAVGVRHVVPEALTVLDIGGQDSKVLRLSANGTVRDFQMNDRCAAGTGRFLEMVASRLNVPLEALGQMARRSRNPVSISSVCAVFAETEIVGLLACGANGDDLAAGVQAAIARRTAAMAGRAVEPPVILTGGVALVPGMDAALAEALGQPVRIAPDPQMTGALGAALVAARQLRRSLDAA